MAEKTNGFPTSEALSTPEYRHLKIREPKYQAITKISSTVVNAMNDYLKKEGFIQVFPPTITSMAAEDPETLFSIQYYKDPAFLSQTAQPYLEALVSSFEKVFSITPVYRRERLSTGQHLSEFWTIELEKSHSNLDDIMSLNENMFFTSIQAVVEKNQEELKILGRDISSLLHEPPYQKITYDDAVTWLKDIEKKNGRVLENKWGEGFSYNENNTLSQIFHSTPLFITHFPVKTRPFYMQPDSNRPDLTLSYDMIAPKAGEMSTGSVRITDPELLSKRIDEHKLHSRDYKWYVDLSRYKPIEHAGFGAGIERIMMYITALEDISDVSLFPRVPYGLPYP